MTVISTLINVMNHATINPYKRADNLGFTSKQARDLKDAILPPKLSLNTQLSSAEKISRFQKFGGWDADTHAFPAGFDINAVIRIKDGAEVRWLDVAARTHDEDFIHFLLESGADLDLCSATTRDSLQKLANDVGFQAVGDITAEEIQNAVRAIRAEHNSDQRIQILENLGTGSNAEAEIASTDSQTGFLGKLDLNAVIRIQGGKEYTLLDFMVEINDKKLALFLIEKGATQCSDETKTTFATEFELCVTKSRLDELQHLTNTHSTPPSSVGSASETNDINDTAAVTRKRSIGSCVHKLLNNPLALASVIAGGSLYGTSIIFNGIISAGYLAAMATAGIGVLTTYATDKAIWGSINLARSCLGYEKEDTRYYMTKIFGGLACLTGLGAVAICANNPISEKFRLVFTSGPAYAGAILISRGLDAARVDETSYEDRVASLNQFFESTQPDMQKENQGKIKDFISKLATERGFKDNYEKVFTTAPASGAAPAETDTTNQGIFKAAFANFRMPIYG